ncbi:ADP-ribosylglycohydrolase family protein [Kiloniella sp. b19]|uniref:ADP-ribosylglycohydrolase family protein n=1 Tax=Kiloniella sp. GXU_MW_B19 TaxID=3141326 RepID=UPI0031D8C971
MASSLPLSSQATAVFGALVADAATMGLHWLYDPERIQKIRDRNGGTTAFIPPLAENFEDTSGYFAHGNRHNGMSTQYGECLALMLDHLCRHDGKLEVAEYQTAFAAYFGAGGSYRGYIDRPTSGTLSNLARGQRTPSGIDDDQHPAISTLPALVAAYHGTAELEQAVSDAMQVTNVNETASEYGAIFTRLLTKVLQGNDLLQAMQDEAAAATGETGEKLRDALETPEQSSITYGEITGRACHLPMSVPLMFHILRHGPDFSEAIELNTRCGGDNAGRAIMIGALLGAKYGLDPDRGIPLDWSLKTLHGSFLWQQCLWLGHRASQGQ